MSSIGNDDSDDPSSQHQVHARANIEDLLADPAPVDWNVVNGLLQQVSIAAAFSKPRCSTEEDPMGRLLLSCLLSRNPPATSLEAALQVFPDSLSHNPAVFFTACRDATPEAVAHMMRHILSNYDDNQDECPYAWIISNHISMEGTKAILEVFPRGVLQKSSFLSSYSLLDYFLMSEDMIGQRTFDFLLWSKFKLVLVAAECCENESEYGSQNCGISPVQTILKRILSRPGMCGLFDGWNALASTFNNQSDPCAHYLPRLFGQFETGSTYPLVVAPASLDRPVGI
jgi:hypothetical protein